MEKTVIDFSSSRDRDMWETVNDVVMGGVSDSRVEITGNRTALFHGIVSLDNNGGFSSMRTHPGNFDLSGYQGLMVRVKGDGKNYRLRLRTDDVQDGVAYQAHFSTEKESWILARLPFDAFTPFFRGKLVADAPDLDPSRIRRIGIMIADRQAGPFRLEIEWIKAFEEEGT